MTPERSKLLISALSVVGILGAVMGGIAGLALGIICVAVIMVIYLKNIAAVSDISQDNPKVKTLRFDAIFSVVYMAALVILAVAANKGAFDEFAEKMSPREFNAAAKLLMAVILALPMAVYGNTAPKLPFNRFAGLRLPWTVRDEQTWLIAHRLLGYLSLPLTVLLFIPVSTPMLLETYVKFWWIPGLFLWIGVPGIISGVYYWRKFSGK